MIRSEISQDGSHFANFDQPQQSYKKPSNILWKSTGNFAIHLILFADEIYPFPGGLAGHNSMRNTEDKVGKKTGCKKEGKEKKREGERNIEIG